MYQTAPCKMEFSALTPTMRCSSLKDTVYARTGFRQTLAPYHHGCQSQPDPKTNHSARIDDWLRHQIMSSTRPLLNTVTDFQSSATLAMREPLARLGQLDKRRQAIRSGWITYTAVRLGAPSIGLDVACLLVGVLTLAQLNGMVSALQAIMSHHHRW